MPEVVPSGGYVVPAQQQSATPIVTKAWVWNRTAPYVRMGTVVREATFGFHVGGITNATYNFCEQALAAIGLPQIWSPHPSLFNLYALVFQVTPSGPMTAYVDVTYFNTLMVWQRGGTTLSQKVTNRNRFGNTYLLTDPDSTELRSGLTTKVLPEPTIIGSRIEPAIGYTGGIYPRNVASLYEGKINSAPFIGYSEQKVMCTNVAFSNDRFPGAAWDMTYEFACREGASSGSMGVGWEDILVVTDMRTGEPHGKADDTPGAIQGTDNYASVNFNDLNLF